MADPLRRYSETLASLESENRLRAIPADARHFRYDLCSNDYMGLAKRCDEFQPEFMQRFGEERMTSSASRLLCTDQGAYRQLEAKIEEKLGRPALLFNSGYHANVGIVSALNLPGTLWATDKLVHASIIDGIRQAGADQLRWNHNDVTHLKKILEKSKGKHERIIVVCESIYSMDGDKAPLNELVALKREYPEMLLYVDEAHAIGAEGPEGLGLCAEQGLTTDIDFMIGTFGKACASAGAFVATSAMMKSYLINCARSLIFSTALPPANAAWTLLMLEKLAGMDAERKHLKEISVRFREGVEEITGIPNPSRSAIVPLVTGDSAKAIRISEILREDGVLALPIRRPTVPPGGERIRFSLHAGLSLSDIDNILESVRKACHQCN